jgi:hypothetical protein
MPENFCYSPHTWLADVLLAGMDVERLREHTSRRRWG